MHGTLPTLTPGHARLADLARAIMAATGSPGFND
jgi:hypothetical protein